MYFLPIPLLHPTVPLVLSTHRATNSPQSPFAIIALPSDASAAALTSRAILAKGIYSLWGHGTTTASLHASVNQLTTHLWPQYRTSSFKFTLDCYQGKRSWSEGLELINSFKYVGFDGEIKMKDPDEEFCIFEEYEKYAPEPKRLFFGRLVGSGGRDAVGVYDLKKRVYISTTSMDAELALITANMAHAGPGKLFYDPFVGTGSMCIAASHFGAVAMGSDIDGRSFKGDMKKKSLVGNYREYGLGGRHLDCFISDLTNSPVLGATGRRWLDGIVCDPPYGVREGLKVLGSKEGRRSKEVLIGGVPSH
jgi:tRNA (guanine10-N2)-methyltransferase